MYSKVAEKIDVFVAFRRERVEPVIFKWANRYYRITKINLVHAERRGRERLFFFSVSDDSGDAFRLSFSTDSLEWKLEEMAVL